jgi:hypothetical protein
VVIRYWNSFATFDTHWRIGNFTERSLINGRGLFLQLRFFAFAIISFIVVHVYPPLTQPFGQTNIDNHSPVESGLMQSYLGCSVEPDVSTLVSLRYLVNESVPIRFPLQSI